MYIQCTNSTHMHFQQNTFKKCRMLWRTQSLIWKPDWNRDFCPLILLLISWLKFIILKYPTTTKENYYVLFLIYHERLNTSCTKISSTYYKIMELKEISLYGLKRVFIECHSSWIGSTHVGVPQSSLLGPFLFHILKQLGPIFL